MSDGDDSSSVVTTDAYQYASLTLATVFLVPQSFKAYYTRSLCDVSAMSLACVVGSSLLWAMYLNHEELIAYAAPTLFVTLNASTLLAYKGYLAFVNPSDAVQLSTV